MEEEIKKPSKHKNKVIVILSLIVISLILIGVYAFAIKPAIQNLILEKQTEAYTEGVQYAVVTIMQEANQCERPVPLTFQNQTMELIWVECFRQALEEEQAQQAQDSGGWA